MEGTGGESTRSISRRCQATNIHHQALSQPPRLTPRSVTPENRRHLRHPIEPPSRGLHSLSLSLSLSLLAQGCPLDPRDRSRAMHPAMLSPTLGGAAGCRDAFRFRRPASSLSPPHPTPPPR
jgi:hypothetical protein